MLRIGTKAVNTYHPEYPAFVMIFIWQTRLKRNTKTKNTPKTPKKTETLWGNEKQLLTCPDTLVHCTAESSCRRASATRSIDSVAPCSIPGVSHLQHPVASSRTLRSPELLRPNAETTLTQRSNNSCAGPRPSFRHVVLPVSREPPRCRLLSVSRAGLVVLLHGRDRRDFCRSRRNWESSNRAGRTQWWWRAPTTVPRVAHLGTPDPAAGGSATSKLISRSRVSIVSVG